MKALRFLILATFLFSCNAAKFYDVQILEIPGKKNELQTPIPIYFIGQTPELKPYFEMVELNAEGKGNINNRKVYQIMKSKAQENGLDAVIDVSVNTFTEEYTSFMDIVLSSVDETEDYYSIRNIYQIRGIGIKFLDNLDYIEDLPEFESIYVDNGNKMEPFLELEFKPTGEVYHVNYLHSYSNTFYRSYLFEHSDYHLLKERNNWRYKMVKPDQEVRKLYRNNSVIKKCIIHYNENDLVESIKVKFTDFNHNKGTSSTTNYVIEEVKYSYNENNQLIKKEILYQDQSRLVISPVYDNEKITGFKYYLHKTGGLEVKLTSTYQFYSKDYLQEFYQHLTDTLAN